MGCVRRTACALELDVEPSGKEALEALAALDGLREALGEKELSELALGAPRERDEPLRAAVLEPRGVDEAARRVALREEGFREQDAQRVVALMVHAEHAHAEGLLQILGVEDPQVAPEDRLDAGGEGVRVKAQAPEDVHQVADAHRDAAAFLNGVDHRVHPDDAVRDGVLGVEPQVYEARIGGHCGGGSMKCESGAALQGRSRGNRPRRVRAACSHGRPRRMLQGPRRMSGGVSLRRSA